MAHGDFNMQPINYITRVAQDPAARVFQGFQQGMNQQDQRQNFGMNAAREARAQELHPIAVQGAQQSQAIQAQDAANRNTLQGQQIAQNDEMAKRRAAYQEAVRGLVEKGADATFEDHMAIQAEFPQLSKGMAASFEGLSDERRKGTVNLLSQAYTAYKNGDIETGKGLAKRYAEAARNSGDEASAAAAEAMLKVAEISPEAAMSSIGSALAVLDAKTAQNVIGSGASQRVQKSVNVGNGVVVQTMRDGNVRAVDVATNTVLEGDEARAAINASLEGDVEQAGNIAESKKAGELDARLGKEPTVEASTLAAKKGVELGLQAFDAAGKVRSNLSTIDRAIAALDAGAKTGQIESRAPTWNAATLELRQVANELGLDVVGSVTFGALSEGELRIAMETALPANMQEADLRNWLVEKRAAQEKMSAYLDEQARFLSRPGNTVSDWLDVVDAKAADRGASQAEAGEPQSGGPSYLKYGADR